MKFTQVAGQTFSGAITELTPADLNLANSYISMDVTIPSTGNFTGTFARLGISEFGNNASQMLTGLQVQTVTQNEANVALQPGTYQIGVPLIAINNPVTFDTNVPFSQIFGDDPNSQLTPAGWEFYVSKSSDSALTMYVDNVRIEPLIPGDDNFDGKVNAEDFAILAANYGGSGKVLSQGDFNGDFTVDSSDFNILASEYNKSAPQLTPPLGTLVPEPASCRGRFGVARRRGDAAAGNEKKRNKQDVERLETGERATRCKSAPNPLHETIRDHAAASVGDWMGHRRSTLRAS